MQFTLLLAIVCFASTHAVPEKSKFKGTLVSWSNVGNWVDKNILRKYHGSQTLSAPVLSGKVFGTVGNSKEGQFGRVGYKKVIFNDDRGRLEGELYHNMVLKFLGIMGAKSHVGGRLEWTKNSANVTLDLNKPTFGGNINITISGTGKFDLKNDTEVSINTLDASFTLKGKKPS